MKARHLNTSVPCSLVLAGCLLAGCTSISPQSLAPGSSVADAQRALGTPTGRYVLPDAGTRLEYARGPYGKHTWMLDFDSRGGLVQANQVLTEARFNRVLKGMTRDEVLLAIGRPSEQSRLGFQRQTVLSYRYETPFCQWFQVGIDERGSVADTGYYPDPQCDHLDPGV